LLQAAAAGGGKAVVEVLGVAVQVVAEARRGPPRARRAPSTPRGPQPRQQLLHSRRRPAAAPAGMDDPPPAAAAGVLAQLQRRHRPSSLGRSRKAQTRSQLAARPASLLVATLFNSSL
jgi:hypothetical protein